MEKNGANAAALDVRGTAATPEVGAHTIFVDLQRCTGCWTCSLACKVGNSLADDEWRLTVRTLGSGEGIDRPAGTWPSLHMSWMPLWSRACTRCPERAASGELPYCVHCCPNGALSLGAQAVTRCEEARRKGFRIFALPAWEGTRGDVVYASKG